MIARVKGRFARKAGAFVGTRWDFLLVLFLLFSSLSGAMAQEVSQRKEVAVFGLADYDWKVPNGALALVDEQIKNVFVNLGRFDVIGMNYRLGTSSVEQFINEIRAVKSKSITLPESVKLGEEAFTEADFNRLVNSFVVVIPSLSYYNLAQTQNGGYRAQLSTTFTFVDAENATTVGNFSVKTEGDSDTPLAAVRSAANGIAAQLTFQIRMLTVFQIKTGIIDVRGSQVMLEFGRNMGVKPGDEYAIVATRVLPNGHTVSDDTGLLVVKEVRSDLSFAQVVYADPKPRVGDQLREIPRLGFDTSLYAHVVVNMALTDPSDISALGLVGVRESISRGFYRFRPFIGAEIPFGASLDLPGIVVNLYGGGELDWYLWRFQLVPSAAIGIGGSIPRNGSESFEVSHIGGFAQLSLNFLLTDDVKIFVDAGYTTWISVIADPSISSYQGAFGGIGATYRY